MPVHLTLDDHTRVGATELSQEVFTFHLYVPPINTSAVLFLMVIWVRYTMISSGPSLKWDASFVHVSTIF